MSEEWSKEEQLRKACYNRELDDAKELIEEGVDVESRNRYGWTPLMYAAESGHVDIVRLLLDHGANIHSKNDCGNTALHRAAFNGHDEVVKLLIERGANLHVRNQNNRSTPLDRAERNKKSSTAIILKAAMKSIKGKND